MIHPPISILITDDDVDFRQTLQGVFEPQGFHTLLAGDGEEALEIVRRSDIHLLLMDVHMPRLSGLETLRQVKQFKSRLPCILMRAQTDERLVQQAREGQAFAVLAKPVSRLDVIHHVRSALAETYDWLAHNWGPIENQSADCARPWELKDPRSNR